VACWGGDAQKASHGAYQAERVRPSARPTSVRTRAVLVLVGTCTLLAAPGGAAASCAPPAGPPRPPSLVAYDQVFAGLVERTTNGGDAAEVRVEDVWHGPDLPPRVVVVGGQLERGVASSADRSYRAGERYAFFVDRADDGSLRDNACTPTAPLSSLASVDPPGTRLPDPSAAAPADPRGVLTRWGVEAAAGAAALTAGVMAVVARRRTRKRRVAP
jgi:hypothetical protein